jgi:DNA primase
MIPPGFIQDLLSRVDIVDVVGRYVQLKKGGANFMGLCPFHNEKSPSFTVSPSKQFYHCFGCGAHGTAIGFLIEYSGMGFVEAVKDLAQANGMVVPDQQDRITPEQREHTLALSDVMTQACDYYRQQLRAAPDAVAYLKRRGLTGEIAARFGMGYAPDGWDNLRSVFPDYDMPALVEAGLVIDKSDEGGNGRKRYDRFRERIMFPIRNQKGQVIGFGGRILEQGEPKYLNSPETPLFSKGHELYGLFEARQAIRDAGYVLVTEGYMDVVALAQMGFAQAVATLGTACSAIHVQKLLRHTDQVVFSFDGDSAGRRAARRALEVSLPHAGDNKIIQFLFLPAEHDPDSYIRELGADAFAEQVKAAMPLSQFLLNVVCSEQDLSTPEGRARALFDAKPLLQQMTPSALRLQIVRALANQTKTTPGEIESLFELSKAVAQVRSNAPPPPRNKRAPPVGLPLQMMRLLITWPYLALQFDQTVLAQCCEFDPDHADMLSKLVETGQALGERGNFAVLAEQLHTQGDEFDGLIREIAADSGDDAEAAKLELLGAMRQIKAQLLKRELDQLMVSGLPAAEIGARYREIQQQQQALQREAEAEKNMR